MGKRNSQRLQAKRAETTHKISKDPKPTEDNFSVDSDTYEASLCDLDDVSISYPIKEVQLIDYAEIEVQFKRTLFEELLGDC